MHASVEQGWKFWENCVNIWNNFFIDLELPQMRKNIKYFTIKNGTNDE